MSDVSSRFQCSICSRSLNNAFNLEQHEGKCKREKQLSEEKEKKKAEKERKLQEAAKIAEEKKEKKAEEKRKKAEEKERLKKENEIKRICPICSGVFLDAYRCGVHQRLCSANAKKKLEKEKKERADKYGIGEIEGEECLLFKQVKNRPWHINPQLGLVAMPFDKITRVFARINMEGEKSPGSEGKIERELLPLNDETIKILSELKPNLKPDYIILPEEELNDIEENGRNNQLSLASTHPRLSQAEELEWEKFMSEAEEEGYRNDLQTLLDNLFSISDRAEQIRFMLEKTTSTNEWRRTPFQVFQIMSLFWDRIKLCKSIQDELIWPTTAPRHPISDYQSYQPDYSNHRKQEEIWAQEEAERDSQSRSKRAMERTLQAARQEREEEEREKKAKEDDKKSKKSKDKAKMLAQIKKLQKELEELSD